MCTPSTVGKESLQVGSPVLWQAVAERQPAPLSVWQHELPEVFRGATVDQVEDSTWHPREVGVVEAAGSAVALSGLPPELPQVFVGPVDQVEGSMLHPR